MNFIKTYLNVRFYFLSDYHHKHNTMSNTDTEQIDINLVLHSPDQIHFVIPWIGIEQRSDTDHVVSMTPSVFNILMWNRQT